MSSDAEQLDNLIQELPIQQKVPVVAIKKLLDERKELDKQRDTEISAIHIKYRKLQEPGINRVSEIVKGASITDEELKTGARYFNVAENGLVDAHKKGAKIKEYWATVLEASRFENLITQQDRTALNALQDIRCQVTPGSIKVQFDFSDNPNFSGCTLHRELIIKGDQPVQSKGDHITWKPNKSLTQKKGSPCASIFHFFEDKSRETADEEFAVQEMVFNELARELVPYSLEYYMGVVDNEDEEDEEFQGFEEDDGEGEEEEDEEEEDKPRKQQKKK